MKPLGRRALVVEDNEGGRVLLEAQLLLNGLAEAVTVTRNAREARAALDAEEPFDIVLCDIKLNGESGLSVMADIRQRFPATAVVAISGFSDASTLLSALYAGVDSYVVKPYQIATLRTAIELASDKAARRRRWEADATWSNRVARLALIAALVGVMIEVGVAVLLVLVR